MAGRFSVETVFKARDYVSGAMRRLDARVGATTRRLEKDFSRVDRQFGKVHAGITRVGRAMAGLSLVGGAAAFNIGKTGADFEEAITAVGAVGLQSRDQIADLEAKAKQLGATTKFTATEAANAMETMARAGFKNSEILSGIDGVLSAAAASGLEIEEVANHVSNALKGMGLATSEAGRVSDVLALASSRTNSTIGTLGESLKNVASTARQFNIPLEDTVGAVALLQDVGLDASVAGSALNTMLTKMAKPPAAVAAQMEKFGVSFKDAEGNMLPFQQVLANVSEAAKRSGGNMDQVAFLADLVGLRGQKAAANLKDLFESGKVQKLTEELRNAEGAAAKMAAIRMNNLKGDVTLLGSAVDAVKVALFETESGPLRGVVQEMTKWVSENQELIVSGFQDWMKKVRDNLDDIVTAGKRIGIVIAVFYGLRTAVWAAQVAVAAYNAAAWTARTATAAWAIATGAATITEKTSTAAIVAGTVAKWARNAATWAVQAATWAYTTATGALTAADISGKVALVAGTVALWARNAATWAVQAATWAFAAANTAVIAPLVGMTAAAWSSVPALWAAAAPLLPITAAIAGVTAAIWLLIEAWQKLKGILGEAGPLETVMKMVDMGTIDPFAANDALLNEKAQARAQNRPQAAASTSSPAGRAADATATASVNGRIEVAGPPGTKVSTGPGHSPGIGMVMPAPSGAL